MNGHSDITELPTFTEWPNNHADIDALDRMFNELADLRAALQDARSENDALKAAAWDAYRILGFDTDGASWQCMVAPSWPEFIRKFAEDERRDHDEALEESGVELLRAALTEVRDFLSITRPPRLLARVDRALSAVPHLGDER